MSLINVISAIGNNNSVVPLFVRDCCIEVPTKVYMTYNQNKSDKDVRYLATRERLVDEYVTSAVWLGGIPLIEKFCKSVIKSKNYNPNIDVNLLKEDKSQGLEYNIEKFKAKAPKEVKELEFLNKNKPQFMKLLCGKVVLETILPMLLMGFVIPKALFAWTARTKNSLEKTQGVDFKKSSKIAENSSEKIDNKKENVSFKGNSISDMAGLTTLQKMYVTDGGYSIGRVLTARNIYAAFDTGFKMLGMLFLNFTFPKILNNILSKSTEKLTGTNVNLDIKMYNDKDFAEAIKNNKIKLPECKTGEEILNYIDKNPNVMFSQYAKKFNKVSFLENGIRDPRCYVDLKELKNFRDDMLLTVNRAIKSKNIDSFMRKAKILKGANVLLNVSISSFLLACGLPKTQFAIRKLVTNCELEPGILD